MRDAVITYILDHPNLPADAPGFADSDGRITPVY
jgi:hypothetical protein